MKFSGRIGFWIGDEQGKPGVYGPKMVEKDYVGDVLRNSRKFQPAENQINENLVTTNKLSIISDIYMKNYWPSIKYVLWNGVRWKVNSVDITSYPRVIIELGGVYNGSS